MKKQILLILVLCASVYSFEIQLKEGLQQVHQMLPEKLQKASLALQSSLELPQQSVLTCVPCKLVFSFLQKFDFSKSFDKIQSLVSALCEKYGILGDDVCGEAFGEMGPYVVENIQKRYFDPDFICPEIKVCPQVYEKIDIENVVLDILKDAASHEVKRQTPQLNNTFKIIHMTDLHFDWDYQIGSYAQCQQPTCCRQESTPSQGNKSMTAGYWGSIAPCDLPYRTIESYVSFIKRNLSNEIDFALWTGDNTNHFIWEQTQEKNINSTIQLTQLFQKEIPSLKIFPIMGNHESFPCNVYDYETDREKDLKAQLAQAWESWIGKEAATQFKENGYYSTVISKGGQNLRIVAVNTQAGNPGNFFLIQNPTDPGHQLKWLEEILTLAEKQNEKVFIMGHIPSDNLLEEWSEVYNALIQRFSSIINAQFYGHTHKDHFKIYKDRNTTNINNVAFIAPSLTTYSNLYPSLRVFEIDEKTLLPVNYFQYRLDINKYNQMGVTDINMLDFELAYDFNSEYGISNISDLKGFELLSEKIGNDLETYNKFQNNYYSGANNKNYKSINKSVYCALNSTPYLQGICKGKYTRSFLDTLVGGWFKKIQKN
ncbi:hypothetical protein ABPG74_003620 [Tetrahymena malaccensis]